MPLDNIKRQCVARVQNGPRKGKQCAQPALVGSTCCKSHLRNKRAIQNQQIRAEVIRWELNEATADPKETLLRLITQSADRVQFYSRKLGEAYEAAERLQQAHEQHKLIAQVDVDYGDPDDPEDRGDSAAVQQAKLDLDNVFASGGIAALIGKTYASSPSGSVYATGEAIRGLAKLESDERERLARWSTQAIAAGLSERMVKVAEQQSELAERALLAALADAGLDDEQQEVIAAGMGRHLRALESAATA